MRRLTKPGELTASLNFVNAVKWTLDATPEVTNAHSNS